MIRQVRNISYIRRYALVKDKPYVVEAQQVVGFEEDIAKALVDQNPGHCIIDDGMNKIEEPEYYGERVWVANVTGNPDSDIPELKEPRVIHRVMQGGQTPDREPKTGEPTFFNQPATVMEIWPFHRKSYPAQKGRWMINRETAQKHPGLVMSRQPTEFEPDDTWDLQDLLLYADIIDPSIPKPDHTKFGTSKEDFEKAMIEEKRLVLKRLFFRIVNPDYRLPTKAEFEVFKKDALQRIKTKPASAAQPSVA